TRSTRFGGATTLLRSDHRRSRISASAMTEAKISGQIGQPAAWTMDHTVNALRYEKCPQCSVAPPIRQAGMGSGTSAATRSRTCATVLAARVFDEQNACGF